MNLECKGHDFSYDINNIIRLFEEPEDTGSLYILECILEKANENENIIKAKLFKESIETLEKRLIAENTLKAELVNDSIIDKKTTRTKLKLAVFDLLNEKFKCLSRWGILVGIRPVKIVHELIDKNYSDETIDLILEKEYRVKKDKRDLILGIARKERKIIFPIDSNKISLYICIPFCPTRCLYCSFPSNSLEKKKKLVQPYLELLLREVEHTISNIKKSGKEIDCIYIGGGTPTSLDEIQLESLLAKLDSMVDLESLVEFTVEAGRPDTITRKKLEIMKNYKVDRICINPQTMNQKTLEYIGREHNTEDIVSIYKIAREIGFKSINMDLIIGLPTEGMEEVKNTLDKVIGLKPENITLHTLAIKRSSRLNEFIGDHELEQGDSVQEMMEYAKSRMIEADNYPYYMYRQKKMLGNLENIGYGKEGLESIYNMRIIEERHTIIALGAGGVSKICYPNDNRFDRVANFKGVEDYISRFDEILLKK